MYQFPGQAQPQYPGDGYPAKGGTMYIPLPFREQNQAELLKLIEQYPLGTLITVIDGRPEVTHLPFIHLVDTQGESRLCAHVAKGNTVWKAVQDGDEVMVVFQGENAYISPGW